MEELYTSINPLTKKNRGPATVVTDHDDAKSDVSDAYSSVAEGDNINTDANGDNSSSGRSEEDNTGK